MNTTTLTKPASPNEAGILALLQSLRQAHRDKDAAAIANCYAADAVIGDLSPPLSHRGIDIAEKQAWLDGWDGPIDLEPRDSRLTIDGDTAFMQGYTHVWPAQGVRGTGQLLAARYDLPEARERWLVDRSSSFLCTVLHGRQPAACIRSAALNADRIAQMRAGSVGRRTETQRVR